MFFGFTNCPDICPATLSVFKQVSSELGRASTNVKYVFITVDPNRDTPEKVQSYISGFNPDFIGLSGSEADLTPVWNAYGVYREINTSKSATDYDVTHSTRIYLIDTHGDLRLTYSFGTPAQDMADDIRFLLKEK